MRAAFVLMTLVLVAEAVFEEERQPIYLTSTVGEHVVFNCPLDFPHDVVIPYILRWNKGGRNVFSWYGDVVTADEDYAGRVSLVSSNPRQGQGSVNLTSIRESDKGWYECVVFFPNRTPPTRRNGTWFHLDVTGDALLNIPPINQTTLEGERAHFPCVIKNNSGLVVNWFKNGDDVSTLTNMQGRYEIEEDGSLTIDPTDMEDPGEYTCVVRNVVQGDQQTAAAFLDVQYKAKVIYSPRKVYLPYGRPGILDCHFRANPPLTNLRWEKDGFLFDPYNVQGVFYRRNGSLYFSKVDESHEGRYTCTPINELGTQGPSNPVRVIVQRPPIFTITPHNLYLRKIGDSLEMPCDAIDGSETHRPTIVWFRKDGSPLPVDRMTMHNGNLTIENLNESDRGLYQCVASNEAATISSDTELMIENVAPRAPYNLMPTASSNSITLRWKPGFERPPMDYSVWYRPQESSEWRTMRLADRGTTEAVITGLSPGRIYELMVLSQDQHGDGMFSKAIQVNTTGNSEPTTSAQEYRSPLGSFQQIGPPRNVSIMLTEEGYVVTWEPPEFGKEELKLYTVRWTEGPREILYGRADTTDTYLLVPLLEEGASYVFQVVATSHNDYQAASNKVLVHVPGSRKMRAIAVGIAIGAAFLVVVAAGAWYVRRLYLRRLASEKESSY